MINKLKTITLTLFLVFAMTYFYSISIEAKTINMGKFKLSAYCPCEECSEGWGRQTHLGVRARSNHTVAADLSVMNLGDWITIDGKKYKVEDSGGGVVGDHIDIFFDTHDEVEDFGIRYGNVKILR